MRSTKWNVQYLKCESNLLSLLGVHTWRLYTLAIRMIAAELVDV